MCTDSNDKVTNKCEGQSIEITDCQIPCEAYDYETLDGYSPEEVYEKTESEILNTDCQDKLDCSSRDYNQCTHFLASAWMRENCPRFCGFCTAPTVAPTVPPRQPTATCNDANPDFCREHSSECSKDLVAGMCKFTCRKCHGEYKEYVHTGACVDKLQTTVCQSLLNQCNVYETKVNCPRTCEICLPEEEPETEEKFANTCKDTNPICSMLIAKDSTKCSNPMFGQMCKESCGQCPGAQGECADSYAGCPRMRKMCDKPYVRSKCKVTCGACIAAGRQSLSTTAEFSACKLLTGKCHMEIIRKKCPISCQTNSVSMTSLNVECEDSSPACGIMKIKNKCDSPLVAKQCMKSCNACSPSASHYKKSATAVQNLPGFTVAPQNCEDNNPPICQKMSSQCSSSEYLKKVCPKSCNTCAKTVASSSASLGKECSDENQMCAMMASKCDNMAIKQLCPCTCGDGEHSATNNEQVCTDKSSRCERLVGMCGDSTVQQMCPLTCKVSGCKAQENKPSGNDLVFVKSTLTSDNCSKDKSAMCPTMAGLCGNPAIKLNCPKTCGSCESKPILSQKPPQTPAISPTFMTMTNTKLNLGGSQSTGACSDSSVFCIALKSMCDKDDVKDKCAKTCNVCSSDEETDQEDITTTNNSNCADKSPVCGVFGKSCHTAAIAELCPGTCNNCKNTPSYATTTIAPTTTTTPKIVEACKDTLMTCNQYESQCYNDKIRSVCAKTCQACDEVSCEDDSKRCNNFVDMCNTPVIARMCRKTCKVCEVEEPITTTTAAPQTTIAQSSDSTCPGKSYPPCRPEDTDHWCCKDTSSGCDYLAKAGYCDKRESYKTMCPESCGFCENAYAAYFDQCREEDLQKANCEDAIPQVCENARINGFLETSCKGTSYSSRNFRKSCKKSCNSCSEKFDEETPIIVNNEDTAPLPEDDDKSWAAWSQWSRCDSNCGGGKRTRNRTCVNSGGHLEKCPGGRAASEEYGVCNKQPCDDDGEQERVDPTMCCNFISLRSTKGNHANPVLNGYFGQYERIRGRIYNGRAVYVIREGESFDCL